MSKEVAGMVQSRRVKGAGSARPESAPTLRWLGPPTVPMICETTSLVRLM